MKPPSLREVRDMIQELRYEGQNRSERLFADAADLMEWLVHEVLRTTDNNWDRPS